MPQSDYKTSVKDPPFGTHIYVHTISPHTPTNAPWVWKLLDLSNEAHLNILMKNHSKLYDAFSGYKVAPHGDLHIFRTVYFTQISFSLPTTSLKSSEVKSLQSKIIL